MASAITVSSGMTMTSASTLGTTRQLERDSFPWRAGASVSSLRLHDADLRRKGAAGTAGDDDGRQQHAHLAQDRQL